MIISLCLFFSLLAASLASKCFSLFDLAKSKGKLIKLFFFSIALVGLFFLVVALYRNMEYVHQFSTWDYLLFRVERDKSIGYSFFNLAPIGKYSLLMGIQYLGFAFVLSGLLWASKTKLGSLRKLIHRRINSGY